MIFQHTIDAVLSGQKTQTRRVVDPDDYPFLPDSAKWMAVGSVTRGKLLKWQVGKTYAVCPGRGKSAVARIKILSIRQERLQDITRRDAEAEGCEGLWSPVHGYHNFRDHPEDTSIYPDPVPHFRELWCSIHTKPGRRWEDNPLVWVLEFKLVEGGGGEWEDLHMSGVDR